MELCNELEKEGLIGVLANHETKRPKRSKAPLTSTPESGTQSEGLTLACRWVADHGTVDLVVFEGPSIGCPGRFLAPADSHGAGLCRLAASRMTWCSSPLKSLVLRRRKLAQVLSFAK